VFLDLGRSPVADAYTATPGEAVPTYPLQVAACSFCRLVQLVDVLPADELFGPAYSFYASASPPLSAYHAQYAADVLAAYADQVARGVIEIGSNDGDLCRHFVGFGRVLGVDPSTGPAAVAAGRGIDTITEPFGLALAERIRDERGRVGLVIANHVLAHVPDVSDVLAGVAALLDDDGLALVEVQYLPDLLLGNGFDLVYHEHLSFFSLSTLTSAAYRHGLHVQAATLTDRQGGSLRVTLGRQRRPSAKAISVAHDERWLSSWGAYESMQGRAERVRTRLVDLVNEQAAAGPVAAYGAPAKLTTLLSFCGLDVSTIAWCEDTTPAKQGRHIPGTGIPIVSPDNRPGEPVAYLLAAHNYAREIMRANPWRRWIVPLPVPVLL
jgi:novobiocin biosynthesis protein NovU/D-mycarose 3-C-methyltransferase